MEKVSISGHARERLAERWPWREIALQAFKEGSLLSQPEMDVMIQKGMFGANYWVRTYKKFNGLIWVFSPAKRRSTVLVTVLPLLH